MVKFDPSSFLPPGTDPSQIDNIIGAYYYSCNHASPTCPVEATTLGYRPNRGINIFFAIGFGLSAISTLYFGIKHKTWSYMAFISAGCLLEMAGYAARIPLTDNPWNKPAFETQIVAIILAPTLICISIYLTLKHVCLGLNSGISPVKPEWYPFIFVPLDVSCLLVQAIGGSLAAGGALKSLSLVNHGNRAIIAGIVLQVVVLGGFGGVGGVYFLRVKRWIKSGNADSEAIALWSERNFRWFVYAVVGAYSGILIRCIYRIAEMAGGWGNHIMQDEPSFIVLEGFMVLVPCILLASFPAGVLFPQMAARMSAPRRSRAAVSGGDVENQSDTKPGAGQIQVATVQDSGELQINTDTEKPEAASISKGPKSKEEQI
ncbi:RTA-like protein [Podospora fimiseda]|uniref:RTA-like protein n=1 Tax=Podospora fimiseda TaxID=252190 RepID=A0AAN7BI43_9PEZI|nr:RTA-like protein [Podospora fimiseda]